MKLGLGLYRHQLDADHFRFARQCGCTDLVVRSQQIVPEDNGSGSDESWSLASLEELKTRVEAEGLRIAAIENFDPLDWHDLPEMAARFDSLKSVIRNIGAAGIPVMGYNFAIGNAENTTPGAATQELHWPRLRDFLKTLLPVAEEAGVILAAHPDDPPVPFARGQPSIYQKLLDLHSSRANQLEFCIGSLAEMSEGEINEAVARFAASKKLAYVRLRGVRDEEPFIGDGEVDVLRVLRILQRHNFQGVIIPDHASAMSCAESGHAGLAFVLGYLRAGIQSLES